MHGVVTFVAAALALIAVAMAAASGHAQMVIEIHT